MEVVAEVLEILMLLCFGCSWPISVYKSWKAKTSVGKSALFNILLIIGYIAGIASKFIKMNAYLDKPVMTQVVFFLALVLYFVNLAMISANLALFYINKRYDKERALMQQVVAEKTEEKVEEK